VRAVVQRVSHASVSVGGRTVSEIGQGMLVLLGIRAGDSEAEAGKLADRLLRLRIFDDATGRMNEPLDGREILCVSQFTLYGDTRKGSRPSWSNAAGAAEAEPLYDLVCDRLGARKGVFGAGMQVSLTGDGPVTLIVEA